MVMTDYNVSDHWSADDPDWLKALVSSLDRRHGVSTILPLTVIAEEVLDWLDLASVDAWKNSANRRSLRLDLDESIDTLGASLRAHIGPSLARFRAAFSRLDRSPATVLAQPPGTRSDAAWTDVTTATKDLLEALSADAAVRASWDDLVAAAQDRTLESREYRPIAELLFDQVRRRGLNAEWTFRDLVSVMAFGRDPRDIAIGQKKVPLTERIARARTHVSTPAKVEPIVVWLGYVGGQAFPHLSAGRVSFMNAHWAVPNAEPGRQDFEHRAELWQLVKHGYLFQVAKMVGEESDVDFLVRVDLGRTTAAGALDRAVRIVDTILDFSIHNSGGIRPHLAQHGLLRSGQAGSSSFMVSRRETGFPDDHYGAGITARAIEEHGPRVASALADGELPRFLAAALEVQTTADRPFSRDMALRKPSEADIRSVIPLSDRVVQHIAAHAALAPNELFKLLGRRWPHSRWLVDMQRAVQMCLLGGGYRNELRSELTREWIGNNPSRPWILFVADRSDDLLSLCRIESERAWIRRMFASVSDYTEYCSLIGYYTAEGAVLEDRRRRVRNALVHGNPASFAIIDSVREYAQFLSRTALNLALESYVEGTAPAASLAKRSDEFTAMQEGQDAAGYWRAQLAARAATSADSP